MSIAETNQKLQISEDYFLIAALTTKYEKMDKWRQWSQWAFRHLLKFKPIMSKKCALWRLILTIYVNYIISVFISPSFYYQSSAGSCPRRWSKLEQHRMTQLSKLSWNLLNVTKLVRLLGNWFQPSHLCLDLEMFERLYIWYREEHTLTHQLLLNISIH